MRVPGKGHWKCGPMSNERSLGGAVFGRLREVGCVASRPGAVNAGIGQEEVTGCMRVGGEWRAKGIQGPEPEAQRVPRDSVDN